MNQKTALKLSGLFGALGVGLGAFGAHALEAFLKEQGRLETWETAVFYHLIHGVVMLLLVTRERWSFRPWLCFFSGSLVFSGSLYVLCLSGLGWLGAITPLGGMLLIVGWLWLAFD